MNAAPRQAGSCDYCGLPLPEPWWSRDRAEPGTGSPCYCCFGCRFAAGVTRESGARGEARWTLTRLGVAVFFTMNVMVFTMALWTSDVYEVDSSDRLVAPLYGVFRYLCLLFSLPVLLLLGGPLLNSAWQGLKRGVLSTDLLLVCGVAAAYLYSVRSVLLGEGHVYFEVGCMVLVMVTLGRWLEATGRLKANAALDALQRLLPEEVRLVRDGRETRLALRRVQPGDRLRVLNGERFPLDGRLLDRAVTVDQQFLTGESRPVEKRDGDTVLGGTLNLGEVATIEVTSSLDEGTFGRMLQVVRTARAAKGRYQRMTDRVATWFFPCVTVVAAGTFALHAASGRPGDGLMASLAVALIACPCALGLATPMAVWAALGRASRRQILFRDGEAFERMAGIRAIRFDKTGTLTTGTPRVADLHCDPGTDAAEIRRRAAALAASSSHTLSAAVRDFCGHSHWHELPSHVREWPGRGVAGTVGASAETVWLGNASLMEDNQLRLPDELRAALERTLDSAGPFTLVGWAGRVRGLFVVDEQLRPEAAEVLASCRREHGLDVAVLTGDHQRRGRELADRLSVPVQSELLPEDKVAALQQARAQSGPVAMVGDGINDAPALAASDVGIAMGCGADVTRESAGVCLLTDDLRRLPEAVDLARRTVRTIRQNLVWAFGYNTIGIGLAAAGWLNPVAAALLMVVSSVLVISNSLRLGSGLGEETPTRVESHSGHQVGQSLEKTKREPTSDWWGESRRSVPLGRSVP